MLLKLTKDLPELRKSANATIDTEAEALRLTFITPGDGQAMAYQQKKLEAEAYLANTLISPAEVPHIAFEAEAAGVSLMEQSMLVVTMFHEWQQISALIEKARLSAKSRVGQAADPQAIETAAQVDWSEVLGLANRSAVVDNVSQ
ncbi:hypothetical protein [Phyllobacterium myrsinacearum]|uniref:Uncharacterized protein n=1 Tax=Phyllobacterium myrsinacearum TaxID=28101 RepID=A0A839ENT1_9HYPH|nr:hypothetical protein [Phyllobacterium myrsinacearum]MBA8881741.1 hypothetical protein [Phyllobacterium myrsinacearum]